MQSLSKEASEKLVQDAFKRYDLNKNGTLELHEVGRLMNDCFRHKHEP